MRVLVTRPREDAARTAEALVDAGYEPFLAPLFRLQPLPFAWPARVDAVVVTSANAVRAIEVVPEFILKAPLLAVGASTASAAVRAGFDLVRASDGDSGALAQLVRRVVKPGAHVLHLSGEDRRDAPLKALSEHCQIQTLPVYAMKAIERLPRDVAQALKQGELGAALHFSPRAATVFCDLAAAAGVLQAAAGLLNVVISDAAKDKRLPEAKVAARPTLEAMVAALA